MVPHDKVLISNLAWENVFYHLQCSKSSWFEKEKMKDKKLKIFFLKTLKVDWLAKKFSYTETVTSSRRINSSNYNFTWIGCWNVSSSFFLANYWTLAYELPGMSSLSWSIVTHEGLFGQSTKSTTTWASLSRSFMFWTLLVSKWGKIALCQNCMKWLISDSPLVTFLTGQIFLLSPS